MSVRVLQSAVLAGLSALWTRSSIFHLGVTSRMPLYNHHSRGEYADTYIMREELSSLVRSQRGQQHNLCQKFHI